MKITKQFLLAAVGTLLLMTSCSQIDSLEKEWSNPLDPQGTNWYPPSVSAMDDTVVAINDNVLLHAQGSDKKEGFIVKYQWSFDRGETWEHESDASSDFIYSWPSNQVGSHIIYVRTVDNSNLFSENDSFTVTVHQYFPIVTAIRDTVASQTATIDFSVSAFDTNGVIEKYYWDVGGDGWDDSTNSPKFSLSYPDGGPATVIWAARDHDSQMARDTFNVLFNRKPESANLALPVSSEIGDYRSYNYINGSGAIDLVFEASDPDGSNDTLRYVLKVGMSETNLIEVYSGNSSRARVDRILPSQSYFWKLSASDLFGDSAVNAGSFISPQAPPPPAGMALINSEGQSFQMGKLNDKTPDTYEHTVTFSYNFWIDSTEITGTEFSSLINVIDTSINDSIPITKINWFDAVFYCNERSKMENMDTVYTYTSISGTPGNNCTLEGVGADLLKLGYRLPTEAEWEYACRGGSPASLYWGASISSMPDYIWYNDNSNGAPNPVGIKPPNPFGLFDMLGNVWEWCNDWYDINYYMSSPSTDPQGPETGPARVVRGSSWGNTASTIAAYTRDKLSPESSGPALGFRVVLRHP